MQALSLLKNPKEKGGSTADGAEAHQSHTWGGVTTCEESTKLRYFLLFALLEIRNSRSQEFAGLVKHFLRILYKTPIALLLSALIFRVTSVLQCGGKAYGYKYHLNKKGNHKLFAQYLSARIANLGRLWPIIGSKPRLNPSGVWA